MTQFLDACLITEMPTGKMRRPASHRRRGTTFNVSTNEPHRQRPSPSGSTCSLCSEHHSLFGCRQFKEMDLSQRRQRPPPSGSTCSLCSEHQSLFGCRQFREMEVSQRRQRPSPSGSTCSLCSEHHSLFGCRQFKEMELSQRRQQVMNHHLCFNCLLFPPL